jgi:DNA polymerase-3 subunit beta
MASKVIDGTFPDYNRVIPIGNDKIVGVGRKELAEAVDRVATISAERSRAVKFDFSPGRLELSVSSAQAGAAVEDVDARYTGVQLHVGFNAKYFLDIAGQIEGDDLQFKIDDAGGPALIADPANAAALYVLMPMRI